MEASNLDEEGLVLHLRFLLLFAVAQAAREVRTGGEATGSGSLAEWAVKRAAANIAEGSKSKPGLGRTSQVFVAWEPLGLMLTSEADSGTVGKDWYGPLVKEYGLQEARFDQGCFGASGVCESELDFLLVSL